VIQNKWALTQIIYWRQGREKELRTAREHEWFDAAPRVSKSELLAIASWLSSDAGLALKSIAWTFTANSPSHNTRAKNMGTSISVWNWMRRQGRRAKSEKSEKRKFYIDEGYAALGSGTLQPLWDGGIYSTEYCICRGGRCAHPITLSLWFSNIFKHHLHQRDLLVSEYLRDRTFVLATSWYNTSTIAECGHVHTCIRGDSR